MNQDQRIDEVLKALTAAEAPDGMEDRVLRRLAAREVRPNAWKMWMIVASGAGVVAALVLVFGFGHRTAMRGSIPPMDTARQVLPLPSAIEPHPAVDKTDGEDRAPRGGLLVAGGRRRAAKVVGSGESGFVGAVSFPAPEAPLTEQERLMVKLAEARRREAVQGVPVVPAKQVPQREVALTHEEMLLVAISHVRQDAVIDALDPVRRAEAEAREKQEFKAYVRQKDVRQNDGGFDETRP